MEEKRMNYCHRKAQMLSINALGYDAYVLMGADIPIFALETSLSVYKEKGYRVVAKYHKGELI